jgi:hypothetical protein
MSLINNRKRRGGFLWFNGYPQSTRAQNRAAILPNGKREQTLKVNGISFRIDENGKRRPDDRTTGKPSYRANPYSIAKNSQRYFENQQYQRPPTSRPPPKPKPKFYSSYADEPEHIKKMREIDNHNSNPQNYGNMRSYAELETDEPVWKRLDREKSEKEWEENYARQKWPSPYTVNSSESSIGERLRERQNRPWREKYRKEEMEREELREKDRVENERKIKQFTDNIQNFVNEHTEKIKDLPNQIIELPNNLMSRINEILGIGIRKGGKKRKPKKTLQKRKKTIRNFPKENQKKQKKILPKKETLEKKNIPKKTLEKKNIPKETLEKKNIPKKTLEKKIKSKRVKKINSK